MLASHSGSIGADIAAGRVLTVPRTADHPIYCEQERRDVTHEVKWPARLGYSSSTVSLHCGAYTATARTIGYCAWILLVAAGQSSESAHPWLRHSSPSMELLSTVRVGRLVGLRSVIGFAQIWDSIVPDRDFGTAHATVCAEIVLEHAGDALRSLTWADASDEEPITATDVANAALLVADHHPPPAAPVQRKLVLLVPNDAKCQRCNCELMTVDLAARSSVAKHTAARPFEVRFLDGSSKPAIELAKTCITCQAVHLYSEVQWQPTVGALAKAALEGISLPAGIQRWWKPDAGGRAYFRFPSNATVAFHRDLLVFSGLADERTTMSKQGLQSVMRQMQWERRRVQPNGTAPGGGETGTEPVATAGWNDWDRRLLTEAWYAHDLLCDERRTGVPVADRTPLPEYLTLKTFNAALRRQGYRGRAAFRVHFAEHHDRITTRPGKVKLITIDGLHKGNTCVCQTEIKYTKRLPGSPAFMFQGCMGDLTQNNCAICDECIEEAGERDPPNRLNTNDGTSDSDEEDLRAPPLDPTLASSLRRSQRLAKKGAAAKSADSSGAAVLTSTSGAAAVAVAANAGTPSLAQAQGQTMQGPVDSMGRQLRIRKQFSYAEKVLARYPPAEPSREAGSKRQALSSSTAAASSACPAKAAKPRVREEGAVSRGKQKAPQTDTERLISAYGPAVKDFLLEDNAAAAATAQGAGAAPIGKNTYAVDTIRRGYTQGLEDAYIISWVGWKQPQGDTIGTESSIHPSLITLFKECEAVGKPFPSYLERITSEGRSLAPPPPESDLHLMRVGDDEPAVGEDLFRIPAVDMMMLLKESGCANNLKAQQGGEPKGGYRSHIGGLLAANASDNICLDWDWFRNSESISASIYFLARLFQSCPKLLKKIKAIAQDDACHLRRSLEAILRRLEADRGDEPDTPAMALCMCGSYQNKLPTPLVLSWVVPWCPCLHEWRIQPKTAVSNLA